MKKWEELIEKYRKEHYQSAIDIIECAKRYIETNHAARSNPCGWLSCPPRDTPQWKEYEILRENYNKAYSDLWMATDVEYGSNELTNAAWEWRYWSVMARKCCFYQESMLTSRLAGKTMNQLHKAEAELMEICGLSELYNSPCSYIEKQFPNLKT